jgi:hypothetical protein
MSGLNVLVQSLVAGVPGLVNAAKSEMIGFGISMSIASQMQATLKSTSDAAFKFIKDKVPDLSDEDALTLAKSATVGVAFAVGGVLQARQLMRQLGSLKMAATSAATRPVATGAVGHMDDAIDSSLHPNVASKPNTVRPSTSGVASKAADSSQVLTFPSKQSLVQSYAENDAIKGIKKFFRGSTSKSRDFKVTELPNSCKRLEFFTPARNKGYGKRYVQELDNSGTILREFKETIGPNGQVLNTERIH